MVWSGDGIVSVGVGVGVGGFCVFVLVSKGINN